MNKLKTIAIVLTYNRCNLLKRCLKKLDEQTVKVDKILVIDNGSTDGTKDLLNSLKIEFISQTNLGSAGGWYTGLKFAKDNDFDTAWLMDDDGYPDKNAYKVLKKAFNKDIACISSVVINEADKLKFVFPFPLLNKYQMPKIGFKKNKIFSVNKFNAACKNNLYPWVHLFNGALISITSVKCRVNVNRDYFLYGDDNGLFFRLRKSGKVLSHSKALHFHPAVANTYFSKTKFFYLLRNSIINIKKYYNLKFLRYLMWIPYILFVLYKRNNFKSLLSTLVGKDRLLFYRSIKDGFNSKLGIYNDIEE